MNVSVVIPAHNAAATLGETLRSLLDQTYSAWDAIVVDDSSTDNTVMVATHFAQQDARIRVVSQSQAGISAARNTGIEATSSPWLLFLDADDWIVPQHLEQMMAALADNADLDGVYCDWARITPAGEHLNEACSYAPNELFAALTCTCTFAIHACVVRRSPVEAVGRFDPSLQTCEDWDLWQRLARMGARFKRVEGVLAHYRMRPSSASIKGIQLAKDAMQVITRGHAADPRVPNPHPAYAKGEPIAQLAAAKLHWIAWAAGLMLGSHTDASPLIALIGQEADPGLDPDQLARSVFYAAILPTCQPLSAWSQLWPKLETTLQVFLQQLEARSMAQGLARRAQLRLAHLVLTHWKSDLPAIVGTTYAMRLEVTAPIADLDLPTAVDRLYCIVELEGKNLGVLELPVFDGWVSRLVLKDAIAAEFSWKILGRFFEHTLYRHDLTSRVANLNVEDYSWGNLTSAELDTLHNQIGWTIFLQELWGKPDWSIDRFYNPDAEERSMNPQRVEYGWLVVEVSEPFSDVSVNLPELDVALTVGGVAIGVITVPTKQTLVTAQALQVALTQASGLELCRAAVREGLVGRSIVEPTSLRSRLAEAANHRKHAEPHGMERSLFSLPQLSHLMPEERGTNALDHTFIIGRHAGAMGTSASRWMMVPVEAAQDLLAAAAIAGEPMLQPLLPKPPTRGLYVPAFIQRPSVCITRPQSTRSADVTASFYDRSHFETTFASQPDPWKYTSEYEQTKYEQALSLLPARKLDQALELACAEGHFTKQLAPRVGSLIAADISQIALQRTAERCQAFSHLSFLPLDLTKDPLPDGNDLIVCSEVLYYISGTKALPAIAQKLANALKPGGYLLMAHANLVVDEPDQPGFDWDMPFGAKAISDAFTGNASLRLVKEIWTPLYRIQLFQRRSFRRSLWPWTATKTIKLHQQPTALLPEVAAHALWQGGQPQRSGYEATVLTERLPILMYHRVAPTGSTVMARYRVTPDMFEAQLKYLRDAGFYSIRWEDWRQAILAKRPLTGRAIVLTFDDGYLDFFEYAHSLLKQYGFSATVFLVAQQIGQYNHWDSHYGETVPLMDWSQIRQLQEEGIEFGSHTANHPQLTALSTVDVVREGARSRAILERGLERPVNALAYPHGDFDPVVQRLIGACGYTYGLSCQTGLSHFYDDLLALPRIEVTGFDRLQDFVNKLK